MGKQRTKQRAALHAQLEMLLMWMLGQQTTLEMVRQLRCTLGNQNSFPGAHTNRTTTKSLGPGAAVANTAMPPNVPPVSGAKVEARTKSPAPTATRRDGAPFMDPAEETNAELTKAKLDSVNVQGCIKVMESQPGMEDVVEQMRHRQSMLLDYIAEISPKPPNTVMAQRLLREIEQTPCVMQGQTKHHRCFQEALGFQGGLRPKEDRAGGPKGTVGESRHHTGRLTVRGTKWMVRRGRRSSHTVVPRCGIGARWRHRNGN